MEDKKIRGQRAGAKFIDEASLIDEEDIKEIESILDTGKENKMEILTTKITSTIECDIVIKLKNKSAIDFKGFGIYVDGNFTSNKVKVEYAGEIGYSNFEIISVKEV